MAVLLRLSISHTCPGLIPIACATGSKRDMSGN